MANCRSGSCRAEILWAETEKGKAIPLNAKPVAHGGTFRLVGIVASYVAKTDRDQYPELYIPHHATCPAVAQWRKSTKLPAGPPA